MRTGEDMGGKGPVVEIMENCLNGVKHMERKEANILPGLKTQKRPEGCYCLGEIRKLGRRAVGEKEQY